MRTVRQPLESSPDVRTLAVRLLGELEASENGPTLDALLARVENARAVAGRRDRALLNAIVFGVLRTRGRLDHILARCTNLPWHAVDPPVQNALRVGLFQIVALDRIPTSAAVSTAVEAVRAAGAPRAAAFVNAVLRRAAARHAAIPPPDPKVEPLRAAAVAGSLPEWLVGRWRERYGAEATDALIIHLNAIPPLTLRANTLKTGRAELAAALAACAERVELSPHAPEAVIVTGLEPRLTETAAFRDGWFQVQDEAAQLVSLLLDPRPGEAVLDACAGRGGKTGHLAQLMGNTGRLVAVDRHPRRVEALGREIERLGIRCAEVRSLDWEAPESAAGLGSFDRILLDAPCSGLGTLRRNPDIRWRASESGLERHGRIQAALLDAAAASLKPGGILVYAVCSPEPEETVAVVDAFLSRRPQFRLATDLGRHAAALRPFLDRRGCLQTYPAAGYMDGFFAARLELAHPLRKEAP